MCTRHKLVHSVNSLVHTADLSGYPPPVNAQKKKCLFIKTKTKVNIEMYLTCNGYTFN